MNVALVKIDVAAAHLGWSADKLFDLVDGGTLLEKGFAWVFNLANDLNGERRDLRFWWPEIQARLIGGDSATRYSYYELEWVINKILPAKRQNFHAGEVDQMFQIRPRTRIDLHAELSGTLQSGGNFYARPPLFEFLTRRWLGAVSVRIQNSKFKIQNLPILPAKNRPAADSRGAAVLAREIDPNMAAAPILPPARGRGNVRTAPSNFHPPIAEAQENSVREPSRSSKAVAITDGIKSSRPTRLPATRTGDRKTSVAGFKLPAPASPRGAALSK